MKSMIFIMFLTLFFPAVKKDEAKFYMSKTINTTIYSAAPLENIEATSTTGVSILNTATREIQFNVPIRSFNFKKKLMQEHFNENYMESDKFPHAKFKGKISQEIDFSVNGKHNVSVTGDLEVHGVKQARTISGTLEVKNNTLSIYSRFDVRCADHDIKIPKLVFRNIAETIRVTVHGTFKPYNQTQS